MSALTSSVIAELDDKNGSCYVRLVNEVLEQYATDSMKQTMDDGNTILDNIKILFISHGIEVVIKEAGMLQRNGDFLPGVFRELMTLEARFRADLESLKSEASSIETRKFVKEALSADSEKITGTKKKPRVPKEKKSESKKVVDPSINPFVPWTQSFKFHSIFIEPHTIEEAKKIRDEKDLKLTDNRINSLMYNYRRGDIQGWQLVTTNNDKNEEVFQVTHSEGAF